MDCFTFKYNVHWEERPLQSEARKKCIEDYGVCRICSVIYLLLEEDTDQRNVYS